MEEEQLRRRRRVNRLKKIILATVAAFIIIPTVLCIFLAIRIHKVNVAYGVLKNSQKELLLDNHAWQEKYEEAEAQIEKLKEEPEVIYQTVEQKTSADNSYSPEEIRKVYLTFDDGPSSNTDKILDILKEYNVKATFFVVGKTDEQYIPMYKRIVEEGHTLGMHSYSHKYNEIYGSKEAYAKDLKNLQDFLFEVTGVKCSIVRFPGGSSNTVSLVDMNELIQYLKAENLTYYDWNVSSGDATNYYISADKIINNCTDGILPCQTAIVLMHDAAEKKSTVDALPKLIERIQEMENTVLLPIDSNTALIQHIQNESED